MRHADLLSGLLLCQMLLLEVEQMRVVLAKVLWGSQVPRYHEHNSTSVCHCNDVHHNCCDVHVVAGRDHRHV